MSLPSHHSVSVVLLGDECCICGVLFSYVIGDMQVLVVCWLCTRRVLEVRHEGVECMITVGFSHGTKRHGMMQGLEGWRASSRVG